MPDRVVRAIAWASGALTAGSLVVIGWTGVLLTRDYRPLAAGTVLWHRRATGVLFVAVLVLVLALVRTWWRVLGAVLATFVATTVAASTGRALAWDQLALRSVTTGAGIKGVWSAAFDADVRFVLVGRTEATQRQYASVLITHLALAPVVLLVVALAVALTRRHSAAATDPPR